MRFFEWNELDHLAQSRRNGEYTDQYITALKNRRCARFIFLINELSIKLSLAFVPIYLVSILPIYLRGTGRCSTS